LATLAAGCASLPRQTAWESPAVTKPTTAAAMVPAPVLNDDDRPGSDSLAHIAQGKTPTDVLVTSNESAATYPIDLPTALRLANAQNTQVLFAQARIVEASAQLEQARVLLLPTLSAGASYSHHDGRLQDVEGNVLEISRSAGTLGLGAGGVAAGPLAVPGVSVRSDLADAIFLPLVARQVSRAREAESRVVQNNVLLSVAIAYLELVRAKAELVIAEEAYSNASELARVTDEFAKAGEGLQSDAERAQVERSLRDKDVEEAHEVLQVRSAQLAELLRLDPQIQLDPADAAVLPIDLVSRETTLRELVSTALENRPELEQSHALVHAACERLRQAKYGPLLPSVLLGFSVGGFGGGTGSTLGNSSDRTDYDAMIVWELRNLGLGDRSLKAERQSQYHQTQLLEVATLDRVSSEVAQAHAQVASRRKQIAIAEVAVDRAMKSFQLNRTRIFEKQGLPIEVLQAIQSLAITRREYLAAVIDYDQAQFRLHAALGQPTLEATRLSSGVPSGPPCQ
jgi:outer membrane protein TolC